MFGLFRRKQVNDIKGSSPYSLALLSVSEKLKPMTQVEFEIANQSLEEVFDWLSEQEQGHWFNGGHFNMSDQTGAQYQLKISRYFGSNTLPVVFTNNTETILHSLPLLDSPRKEVGVIHIGHQFDLKDPLDVEQGSAFHFALARYNGCRLFCLGVDDNQSMKTFEYAEDLGCDWMKASECTFSHRFAVKQQLAAYLAHCDEVILNIDLASLYPKLRLEHGDGLDVQIVNRIIRLVLMSQKTKLIQLVGWKDKHIYSKATQGVLHEIATMVPSRDCAA